MCGQPVQYPTDYLDPDSLMFHCQWSSTHETEVTKETVKAFLMQKQIWCSTQKLKIADIYLKKKKAYWQFLLGRVMMILVCNGESVDKIRCDQMWSDVISPVAWKFCSRGPPDPWGGQAWTKARRKKKQGGTGKTQGGPGPPHATGLDVMH